jgi:hypothetical protein
MSDEEIKKLIPEKIAKQTVLIETGLRVAEKLKKIAEI